MRVVTPGPVEVDRSWCRSARSHAASSKRRLSHIAEPSQHFWREAGHKNPTESIPKHHLRAPFRRVIALSKLISLVARAL